MAARKTYRTTEEALAAVFALPLDANIFENDLDGCSSSEDKNDGAEVGLRATRDVPDDDSDDNIMYRLASSDAEDDSDLSETCSTTDNYDDC